MEKTTKNPGRWSRFGKFGVRTKKTQGFNHMGQTTKKRMKTAVTPRKINPYELHDQELKIEESKRAEKKSSTGKGGSSKNSRRILRC